jgi:hypothetical protein
MARHSSARSRQRCARYNGFGMIPSTLAMLATTQKVRGIGSVPVPAFTQSRVIPGLQSRVRESATYLVIADVAHTQNATNALVAAGHKRTLAEQCSVMLPGAWSDGGLMHVFKIRRPSRNGARKAASGGGQYPETVRRNRHNRCVRCRRFFGLAAVGIVFALLLVS